jgi:hypothetical protein
LVIIGGVLEKTRGNVLHFERQRSTLQAQRQRDLAVCRIDRRQKQRATTKRDSLSLATEFAEDWYLELRGKDKVGILLSEKNFVQAVEQFLKEYEIITKGERSKK